MNRKKVLFNLNEIITIVMEEVTVNENKILYGIENDESFPKYIDDKFNMMNEDDIRDFMFNIEKIADEILVMKSGELNELNKCHEEIIYLADEFLNEYLEKK